MTLHISHLNRQKGMTMTKIIHKVMPGGRERDGRWGGLFRERMETVSLYGREIANLEGILLNNKHE